MAMPWRNDWRKGQSRALAYTHESRFREREAITVCIKIKNLVNDMYGVK